MILRALHRLVHPLGGRGAWWLPDWLSMACWRVCERYAERFEP